MFSSYNFASESLYELRGYFLDFMKHLYYSFVHVGVAKLFIALITCCSSAWLYIGDAGSEMVAVPKFLT